MNCTHWEERLALYAGGDLPPGEAADVEQHLRDCPGCQLFASGLKESLDWLQDMDREPIAPAHFAAVRARVLAELEAARQPWWRKAWLYGIASAAAAALLLMLVLPHGAPPAAPKRAAVEVRQAPAVQMIPVRTPPVVRVQRRPKRKLRPPAKPINQGPPLVVKLVTDDPDIVIYWIADKSGE